MAPQSLIEAGVDEAGRGALAGPVVAAAVVLPPDAELQLHGITDSKLLSAPQREAARIRITEVALAWSVGVVEVPRIDEINILRAALEAMAQAVASLTVTPQHLAVDGKQAPPVALPCTCVIKGDQRYLHIAAASILAKTHRDDLMRQLHQQYPHYGWATHKGYPTRAHREAIRQYGPCPQHRLSFRLLG
jgi:ribonuclease HII